LFAARRAGVGMPVEGTPLLDEAPCAARPPVVYLGCVRTRKTAVLITVATLFFSIAIMAGASFCMPSALYAMHEINGSHSVFVLPAVRLICFACGKASMIVVVHRFGSRMTISAAAAISSVGLLLTATTAGSQYAAFVFVGVALDSFADGHTFGAALRALTNWVDNKWIGTATGVTYVAHSVGLSIFTVTFSALQAAIPAEQNAVEHAVAPFQLMGGLQLFASMAAFAMLRTSAVQAGFAPPQPPRDAAQGIDDDNLADGVEAKKSASSPSRHPLDGVPLVPAVLALLRYGRFYGVILSQAFNIAQNGLGMFIVSVAVGSAGYSDSDASLVVTVGAVSAAVFVLVAGLAKDVLPPSTVRMTCIPMVLLSIGAFLFALLLQSSHASNDLANMLPVIFAFSNCSYWCHILILAMSMRLAGPTHSATIFGVFEFVSDVVSALYQLVLGAVVDSEDWTAFWALSLALCCVGGVAMVSTLYFDATLPPYATAVGHG